MKPLILFLTISSCFATDLETDIQQLERYSQNLKTLIIDHFDHLEYNYFKHFYPDLMQNYEGRHIKLEKCKIGDVFFEPVENFKWKVHNYRGEKDKTLTDHFETALKKIIQEPDLTAYESDFKNIYEKTHERVMKSCNNAKFSNRKNKSQLSNEEKQIMHAFIRKSIDPGVFGDLDIILKFFILTRGAIAESSSEIILIAAEVLCQGFLHNNKRVLLLHALRCLKKSNINANEIAALFVRFGHLKSLKLFESVFGKKILDSKVRCLGMPSRMPMIHCTLLDGFLHNGFEKLKWMIDEQGVDPTKRQVTLFGSIDVLERFKMSVERTETNKRIYDEITGYLCNEIEATESKKSLKRKMKDCVVNRSFFNCEPLLRKIVKNSSL